MTLTFAKISRFAENAYELGEDVQLIVVACIVVICLSMVMALYRVAVGPNVSDRVLGAELLSVLLIALVLLLSVRMTTPFLDAALVLSLLGFGSTVAMAQFIYRQQDEVDESSKTSEKS